MGTEVICILGMHRSGTSCLAGSLQASGLHLGDVITEARHNLKGNRENKRIMDLHEDVLKASGGAWDDPPDEVEWSAEHIERRREIIRSYGDVARWGFKDPRTLLTLEGWREDLPGLSFVGTFRHPLGVAESLKRRNGGSVERWVELWIQYNRILLDYRRRFGFPTISFDLDDEEYRAKVATLAIALKLGRAKDGGFFEPRLRHSERYRVADVPEAARALYRELRADVGPS